ncbi:NAD(P)/FAD-dependent oxidoreductase [Ornithinimicrobium pratense]|uniref:NAD(P)/FAD-dependent oxidoreductase n=1 Tax=Ornithinimicrobium pratense TaxID=2593973 RepID=A0A5J6V849_9MICO|nr:NAD(P)/FAD-dependent oxidoreductase [Ornithinimicrobium pratense]QFG69985.1 NAD(P)/FAD-dependent oxidoreductase [Ornithinimicrobium pratense]
MNQTQHSADRPGSSLDRPVRSVVVVGGGPAGLQATLTLGRVHRDVVLLDAGDGRNAPASAMHNLITRDGTPPAEFRRLAHAELTAYPTVEVRAARVRGIEDVSDPQQPESTRFRIDLEGGSGLTARRLVLATGVRDQLPDIPGVAELWGDLVAHCPFCHGHEFAGRRVVVLGAGPAGHLPGLLAPVASEVVVLTNGEDLSVPVAVPVLTDPVAQVRRHGEGVRIALGSGQVIEAAGIFVGTGLRQSSPFAEQLGLELNPSGCVRVDERGRASRAGVYAAGDMAHVPALPMPMASVAQAVATGALAAATVVADSLADG